MSDFLHTDQWGHAVTAVGPGAVAALDKTCISYLAIGRQTGGLLKAVFEADPDMVMAHCLKGYFLLLMGSGPLKARVPKSVAAAEAAVGLALGSGCSRLDCRGGSCGRCVVLVHQDATTRLSVQRPR